MLYANVYSQVTNVYLLLGYNKYNNQGIKADQKKVFYRLVICTGETYI